MIDLMPIIMSHSVTSKRVKTSMICSAIILLSRMMTVQA